MGKNKEKTINEHINRIKYVSNYIINEANYYKLVDNIDEDDEIPDEIFSSSEPEEKVIDNPEEEPNSEDEVSPDMDGNPEEEPIQKDMEVETPEPEMPAPEAPMEAPQQSVDQIQNDVLKSSLSAMEKMNDQLKRLEMSFEKMNSKMLHLNHEVEEVKEPTNIEKLEAKKEDSYPYYMNLNDLWKGNSFQARVQLNDKSKGMLKQDDGTYKADFDTLPKYNEQEIKDSF